MKQVNLFGKEFAINEDGRKYSSKIEAPIYEPKNKQPHIIELFDNSKTNTVPVIIDSKHKK